ncbi:MAG: hypothetical protein OER90_00680 [Gemmatimonadota bacterium]|nr:hypothetical protein [Gemmatimonadota bacterium]
MMRYMLFLVVLAALGCASKPAAEEGVAPEPLPLPTMLLAGRRVALFPVTLMVAEERLGWRDQLTPRADALAQADSIIATFLTERAPDIEWVLPEALRRAAAQAPRLLPNPDHMGTAVLRANGLERIPDPLRSDLRNLTAIAGDRYAAIPVSLLWVRTPEGGGRAELTLVVADVRFGMVRFRTIASGEGDDPWSALWTALATLVPDLP